MPKDAQPAMIGLGLTIALVLGQPASAGEPGSEGFQWNAPGHCPDQATLERTLAGALGRGPDVPLGLLAEGTASNLSGKWQLELRLVVEGRTSTRHIEADTCRELAVAAVLVVAVAVHPDFVGTDIALDEEQPVDVAAVPEPPTPAPRLVLPVASEASEAPPRHERGSSLETVPAPEPPSARSGADVQVDLRIAAGPGLRLLPHVTAALELALGLAGPHWRVELGGTTWTPTRLEVEPGQRGSFLIAAGTARGCGVPGRGAWRFPRVES